MRSGRKKDAHLVMAAEWQEIARYGQPVRCYWLQWESLNLRDELITRKWGSSDEKKCYTEHVTGGSLSF